MEFGPLSGLPIWEEAGAAYHGGGPRHRHPIMVPQDSEGGGGGGDVRVEDWAGRSGGEAAHLGGPARAEGGHLFFLSFWSRGTEEGES